MAKCYYCGGEGILPSLPMDVVCPVCDGEGTLARPKKATDNRATRIKIRRAQLEKEIAERQAELAQLPEIV